MLRGGEMGPISFEWKTYAPTRENVRNWRSDVIISINIFPSWTDERVYVTNYVIYG